MYKHVFLTGPPGTYLHTLSPDVQKLKPSPSTSVIQLFYRVNDDAGSKLVLSFCPDKNNNNNKKK